MTDCNKLVKVLCASNVVVKNCIYLPTNAQQGHVWTSDDKGKGEWKEPNNSTMVDDITVPNCIYLPTDQIEGDVWTSDEFGKGSWQPYPDATEPEPKKYPINGSMEIGDPVVFVKDGVRKVKCEEWEWQGSYTSGIESLENRRSIVTDTKGNVYIVNEIHNNMINTKCGQYYYYNPNDHITPAFIGQDETNYNNVTITKINNCGEFIWQATIVSINDTHTETNPTIAIDNCDNIYVGLRENNESLFFDAGVISNDATLRTNMSSYIIAKLSSDGIWQWRSYIIEPTGNINFLKIDVDDNRNVYVAGDGYFEHFYNSDQSSISLDDAHTASTETLDRHIFVAKMDTNGFWLWNTIADTPDHDDDFNDMIVNKSNGNAIIVGIKRDNMNAPLYYDTNSIVPSMTGRMGQDIQAFIGNISSLGVWLWESSIDNISTITSINIDKYNNTYVVGSVISSQQLEYYSGDNLVMNGKIGLSYTFITKMNAEGVFLWEASTELDKTKLCLDKCDNIFVCGNPLSTQINHYNANVVPENQQVSLTTTHTSLNTYIVAKVDAFGNFIWVNQIEYSQNIISPVFSIYTITSDFNNNLYVDGVASDCPSNVSQLMSYYNPFPISPPTFSMNIGENANAFIAKIVNDVVSEKVIGFVQDITDGQACVSFNGNANVQINLNIGQSYYLQSTYPCIITENRCNLCNCKNKFIGQACSQNEIIIQ